MEKLCNFFKERNLTQHDVAEAMGVSTAYVNAILNGRKRIGRQQAYKLENLFGLSSTWLLTGEGNMTKDDVQEENTNKLPLLPYDALAGALTGVGIQVMEYDCEKYVVPAFKDAEFLVRVTGDSMMPRYFSGDIVACKTVVMDRLWFQWGKTYVISTNQGVLIKRIESSDKEGCISIHSYNSDYKPFDFPASEINGIAIVVGLIRQE